jgi:hypothetical protein
MTPEWMLLGVSPKKKIYVWIFLDCILLNILCNYYVILLRLVLYFFQL